MTPFERLRFTVAVVIISAWLLALGYSAVNPAYAPPAGLTAFALAVAGFLFGPSLVRYGNGKPKGNDDG